MQESIPRSNSARGQRSSERSLTSNYLDNVDIGSNTNAPRRLQSGSRDQRRPEPTQAKPLPLHPDLKLPPSGLKSRQGLMRPKFVSRRQASSFNKSQVNPYLYNLFRTQLMVRIKTHQNF